MTPTTDRPAVITTARPTLRKRWLLPLGALAYVLVVFGATFWRGSRVETTARDAASLSDGVVTQIARAGDGRPQLRASAVLDAPMETLWQILTDYEHHGEVFSTREGFRVVESAGDTVRVTGRVRTGLGSYPVDLRITQVATNAECRASWDSPSDAMTVNRGSWTLTKLADRLTRVVYALDVEIRPYPQTLVRAAVLGQLAEAIESLDRYCRPPSPDASGDK